MNGIYDIIKLLEEDTEHEVVEYIRNNIHKIKNTPVYNWNVNKRNFLIAHNEVSNKCILSIIDYSLGVKKVYFRNMVEISLM